MMAVAEEAEWYSLFALALTTGMRPSEYLALKWSDIELYPGYRQRLPDYPGIVIGVGLR